MHRILLIIGLLLFTSAEPGSDEALYAFIRSLHQSDALKNAQWSVSAQYTDNGETILDYNGTQSLAPASGLKLLTSAAALSILGGDYRFTTSVYYEGKIENDSTLNGNLILVGRGDPTLGSSQVEGAMALDRLMHHIYRAVKKSGITRINGTILADDTHFEEKTVPDHWPWVDIGNYYGAGSHALSIHDNLYRLYFKPGRHVGDPTSVLRTEPHIPGLTFRNYITTGAAGSGDNGYIYCAPGQYQAVLRGAIPAGVDEFSIKGAIPDAALFAARYLTRYLQQNGVTVQNAGTKTDKKRSYSPAKSVLNIESPPLKKIIYMLNKRSINLYAESLIKTLAVHDGKSGTTGNGLKVIRHFLKNSNIPTDGLFLYDGSGLSPTNAVTTNMMVTLLTVMRGQSCYDDFLHSLGVAADPDDISYFKHFGNKTILEGNARLKSGLITDVRSHSGYVWGRSGRQIAFSVIANHVNGSIGAIDRIHEQLLVKLAESN